MGSLSWAGVLAMIVVAIIGGRFALAGQRAQSRTQTQVAVVQRRSAEGRLALDMAVESRDRLDILEEWQDEISDWWDNDHRPRDEMRDNLLHTIAPDQFAELPKLTPIPRVKRRPRSPGSAA